MDKRLAQLERCKVCEILITISNRMKAIRGHGPVPPCSRAGFGGFAVVRFIAQRSSLHYRIHSLSDPCDTVPAFIHTARQQACVSKMISFVTQFLPVSPLVRIKPQRASQKTRSPLVSSSTAITGIVCGEGSLA
ncbi:hypothetical protein ARMSODRAFT_560653 [Armillaria solidipes]|uniref:Uncharacterized protein n=1 Tax=Armillaria solidipes TaxID=1076256 RepID=A0A2H3BFZ2_9AGAR|nr:hypothetical protein ARMSODRAFT_560653 [Armillaria solidipes]